MYLKSRRMDRHMIQAMFLGKPGLLGGAGLLEVHIG